MFFVIGFLGVWCGPCCESFKCGCVHSKCCVSFKLLCIIQLLLWIMRYVSFKIDMYGSYLFGLYVCGCCVGGVHSLLCVVCCCMGVSINCVCGLSVSCVCG